MQLSKKKESSGNGPKTLYTGFFAGNVVAISPDKEALAELLGYELKEDAKEISYESKDKEENEVITISFWEQADTPGKELFQRRIRITDKEAVSKTGKKQYVNQSGMSSWVDDPKNLQEWFTQFQEADKDDTEKDWKKKKKINVAPREHRVALQGEAELYEYLQCWLGGANLFGKDEDGNYANILIDKKKFFRNPDKYIETEFRSLIGSDYARSVTECATIYTGEKDGKVVHYQNLGKPIPHQIKDGVRHSPSISVIRVASASNSWSSNAYLKKYIEDMTTGEYQTKDVYSLTMLQEWDPNNPDNPISSTNEVLRTEEGVTADTNDDSLDY